MDKETADSLQAANLKREKRILNVSFVGSVMFLVAELIVMFYTGSKAVLMDCVYDLADLAMIGPFMLLIPLLYKKETEKRPFGFSQIESLFVLIKYMILLVIDVVLIIDCIHAIVDGGNHVDSSTVAVFELGVSAGCVLIWILLRKMANKYKSPSIKAEMFIWKLDALSTLGVGTAFAINLILVHTPLAWICPYMDPGIAVILAVALAKEPICMIIESLRSLVLFAPADDVFGKIDAMGKEILGQFGCEVTFTDVIKTGRKFWIQIFFTHEKKSLDIGALKLTQEKLTSQFNEQFDNVDISLIPDLSDGFKSVEPALPPERRKDKIAYIESQENKKTSKGAKKS